MLTILNTSQPFEVLYDASYQGGTRMYSNAKYERCCVCLLSVEGTWTKLTNSWFRIDNSHFFFKNLDIFFVDLTLIRA